MPLPVLETLLLNWNQLVAVSSNTFKGLGSLEYLSLRYNKITSIATGALADSTKLRELDLGHNDLETLSDAIFSQKDSGEKMFSLKYFFL